MKSQVLFAVAMLVASTQAVAVNVRCDHCDMFSAEAAAKSLGPGEHVIFSLSRGTAHAFSNECDASAPGFEPGVASLCTFPRELTPDESAQFQMAQRIHGETRGTMKYESTVPIRDLPIQPPLNFSGMTSHEFARRMGDWHRVSQAVVQWARSPTGTFGQTGQWWQTSGSIVGMAGTEAEITVVFADGGKVTFRVDYADETMGEQRGPIRDADNNVVPTPTDSPLVHTGTVVFSSASAQNSMNAHLANIGATYRFPELPPTCRVNAGAPMIYECTGGSSGGAGGIRVSVTCRRLSGC